MPNFRRMHQFVGDVNKYNTRHNDEDGVTVNSLTDDLYLFDEAIKKDNALRRFKDNFKYSTPEVAEVYHDVEQLGFIRKVITEDDPRVAGEILLVEFAGKEFLHRSKFLHLKTGLWEAWLRYHDKKLILLAAIAGGGVLGNIEYFVRFFRWVF